MNTAVPVSAAAASNGGGGGMMQMQDQLQLLLQVANLQHQQQQQQQQHHHNSLTAAAMAAAGVTVDTLDMLNPGYKRKSSVDTAPPSALLTPVAHSGGVSPKDDAGIATRPGSPSLWAGVGGGGDPNGAAANRRNKTFSPEMSDLFVHEVIKRRETLVENNTNREVDFNRLKKQAWNQVFEAVRAAYPAFQCSIEGMKTHWRYRKRRVRDAAPYMTKYREQGVDSIGERMNDADWAIYDILQQTTGIGGLDGSAKSHSNTSSHTPAISGPASAQNNNEIESDLEAEKPPLAKIPKMEDVISGMTKANMHQHHHHLHHHHHQLLTNGLSTELLPSPNGDSGGAPPMVRSSFTPPEDEFSRSTTLSELKDDSAQDRYSASMSGGSGGSGGGGGGSGLGGGIGGGAGSGSGLLQPGSLLQAAALHAAAAQAAMSQASMVHPPLVSPIVVPALRPMQSGGGGGGGRGGQQQPILGEDTSEEEMRKTLIRQKTLYYSSMCSLVNEVRNVLPLLVSHLVTSSGADGRVGLASAGTPGSSGHHMQHQQQQQQQQQATGAQNAAAAALAQLAAATVSSAADSSSVSSLFCAAFPGVAAAAAAAAAAQQQPPASSPQ